jgi:hypothetical protein
MRSGVPAVVAVAICCVVGSSGGRAQVAPTASENTYNEELLRMTPEQRAAKLADHLGLWCVGVNPFYMGMTKQGAAKGYAYWSITCAGTASYMVQITPDGIGAALDCRQLKAQGQGRECYKTF